eukprot:Colp12_sorted_trinity150504_noHs@31719
MSTAADETRSQCSTSSEEEQNIDVNIDEKEWEDWEEEAPPSKCLFCESMHATTALNFKHCAEVHGFDMQSYRTTNHLDFYQYVKLVNFIRSEVAKNPSLAQSQGFDVPRSHAFWDDETYLKPVIPDDPLLVYEDEDDDDSSDEEANINANNAEMEGTSSWELVKELRMWKRRAQKAEEELTQARETSAQFQAIAEATLGLQTVRLADSHVTSTASADKADQLDHYFGSYSHYGIHAEMLQDTVRTESYRDAFFKNLSTVKDKVVLDVGCGTGILCLFAAKAGAKKVIGIDNSTVIEQAKQIVKDNGFEDVITLIRGKVEEVEIPVEKVDIIVSEWMGYFLLFESMLDTVIWARDKWLAPGGLVFPDKAGMYIVAISKASASPSFWDNVYGFDMKAMKKLVQVEANVEVVPADVVISTSYLFKEIDITTTSVPDLAFVQPFHVLVTQDSECEALLVYFDIMFEAGCSEPVYFGTGPQHKYTHWKQTVLYLQTPVMLKKGDSIDGTISVKPNAENHRAIDIDLDYTVKFTDGQQSVTGKQFYHLG